MCTNCLGTKRRIKRVEELEPGQRFGMTTCECHPDMKATQPVKMVRQHGGDDPNFPRPQARHGALGMHALRRAPHGR